MSKEDHPAEHLDERALRSCELAVRIAASAYEWVEGLADLEVLGCHRNPDAKAALENRIWRMALACSDVGWDELPDRELAWLWHLSFEEALKARLRMLTPPACKPLAEARERANVFHEPDKFDAMFANSFSGFYFSLFSREQGN